MSRLEWLSSGASALKRASCSGSVLTSWYVRSSRFFKHERGEVPVGSLRCQPSVLESTTVARQVARWVRSLGSNRVLSSRHSLRIGVGHVLIPGLGGPRRVGSAIMDVGCVVASFVVDWHVADGDVRGVVRGDSHGVLGLERRHNWEVWIAERSMGRVPSVGAGVHLRRGHLNRLAREQ